MRFDAASGCRRRLPKLLLLPALLACSRAPAGGPLTAAQRETLPRHFGFAPVEVTKLDHRIGPLRIADLNGDGLHDLAVANNYKSTLEILLQREKPPADQAPPEEVNELPEHWRFEKTSISVVWEIAALELADVTGDGRADVVFFGDPAELVVLRNKGDASFAEPLTWRVPDGMSTASALTCGDFNGDQRTDIALLAEDDILTFFQDDSGRLREPTRVAHASDNLVAIEAADLDGDGLDDLTFVLLSDDEPVQFRLQTAAHRLGPVRRIRLPRPRSGLWAPCLGRRQDDLFCVEQVSGRLKRWVIETQAAEGGPHEADVLYYPLPAQDRKAALPMALADVDGNGLTDVVVADVQTAQLRLHRQITGIGLLPGEQSGGQVKMRDMRAFDADGDGWDEIYVLSAEEQSIGVSRFADDRLCFPRPLRTRGTPQAMDVGRLKTASGEAVLAYVCEDEDEVYHLIMSRLAKGQGGAALEEVSSIELEDLDTRPAAVRLVDINHDGLRDALVFVPYEPLTALLQKPDGSMAPLSGPGGGQKGLVKDATAASAAFADVDGDGHLELLLAQKTFVRALRVGPGETWEVVEQFNAPSGDAEITGVAVIPSDGGGSKARPDLAMYNKRSREVHLFKPRGTARYELDCSVDVGAFDLQGMIGARDGRPLRLAGGDRPSILLADARRFAVLLPGTAAAQAHEAGVYETSIRDGRLTRMDIGDLNHDGRTDLAVIEAKDHFVEILTFDPEENLVRANKFRVFAKKRFRGSSRESGGAGEPREIHIADLTGDGRDDLLLIAHDRLLLYPAQ